MCRTRALIGLGLQGMIDDKTRAQPHVCKHSIKHRTKIAWLCPRRSPHKLQDADVVSGDVQAKDEFAGRPETAGVRDSPGALGHAGRGELLRTETEKQVQPAAPT